MRSHVGRVQCQHATVRHGITRVYAQVDHHLLELVHVHLDQRQVAAMHDLQLDHFTQQPAKQVAQVRQHIGQRKHLGTQRLPARERQQLPNQVGSPVGVLLDVHDVGKRRVCRPVARQQQV